MTNNDATTDFVDVAASYSGSMGGMDLGLYAHYGTASAKPGGTDPEVWGGGINLGFGAFKIGGSFGEQDGTADNDGSSFDVGASYSNGPWSYSLTYFEGNNIDDEAVKGADAVSGSAAVIGVAGIDLNADGDFLDAGETLPTAAADAVSGSNAVAAIPGAKEELKQIIAAVTYKVNGNFKVSAFIADVSFDEDSSSANDIEATIIGFGAKFSF